MKHTMMYEHARSAASLALTLAAALLIFTGCATRPATSTSNEVRVNNVSGSATAIVSSSLEKTHDAARKAVSDLKFTGESDALDAFKGVLRARTADRTLVTVTTVKKGDSLAEVSVNTGAFNPGLAQSVLDEIQKTAR